MLIFQFFTVNFLKIVFHILKYSKTKLSAYFTTYFILHNINPSPNVKAD